MFAANETSLSPSEKPFGLGAPAHQRETGARVRGRVQRVVRVAAVQDDADRRVERIGAAAAAGIARRRRHRRDRVLVRTGVGRDRGDIAGIGGERIGLGLGALRGRGRSHRRRGLLLRLHRLQFGGQRLHLRLQRLDPLVVVDRSRPTGSERLAGTQSASGERRMGGGRSDWKL